MANHDASYTVPLIINGEEIRHGKTFDVVSPETGKVVHNCVAATLDDADAAVDAAAAAFKTWKRTTPPERRDIFLKAAEILGGRREELIRYARAEAGIGRGWSDFIVGLAIGCLKDLAGRLQSLEGSFPATEDPNISSIIMSEPYGVVLAIAPWNAPYILGTRAIATPIAAGNTVVFKASELAPQCMWAIVDAFREAGLPPGVINMITHDRSAAAEVTESLVANPLVKKINFTGSTPVGRIIGKLAGQHLKPVVLELGGKAPAIVWEDADLDHAAGQCAMGALLNAGQVCMCTDMVIVHKAVRARFCEKLVAAVENFAPSSGEEPVLINSAAVGKNMALIKNALSQGASAIVGDPEAVDATSARMRPIILDKVTTDMDIYGTESFGPSLPILEVETEEEALRVANGTEFGLNAAVFTEDLRRGLRLAKEIEAGAVHINTMTLHDEFIMPHGGTKASGFGRFNANKGLEEWVRTKSVSFRN